MTSTVKAFDRALDNLEAGGLGFLGKPKGLKLFNQFNLPQGELYLHHDPQDVLRALQLIWEESQPQAVAMLEMVASRVLVRQGKSRLWLLTSQTQMGLDRLITLEEWLREEGVDTARYFPLFS